MQRLGCGSRSRVEEIAAVALVLSTAVAIFVLWLSPDRAWLHPELVAIGSHIACAPRGLGSAAALVVDWADFAGEPQRARVVTGLFEVIDGLARPYIAHVYAHPVLSITTVLYVVLVPTLFYGSLRLFGLSVGSALLFCGFLIATTGFLSNLFAYIHAGKPISFILIAATVFLLAKYAVEKRGLLLLALAALLFIGLLTDELLLWNIVFIPASLFLLGAHRPAPRVAWAVAGALALYAASLLLILPWLQLTIGHATTPTGVYAMDREHPIFRMFSNLLRPDFYAMAIRITARPLLASVGLVSNSTIAIGAAATLIVMSAGMLIAMIKMRANRTWQLAAVSLLGLCSFATFGTWLLWHPGRPAGLEGYAAVNYYYNSPVALFVVLFAAAIFKAVEQAIDGTARSRHAVTLVLAGTLSAAATSSILTFLKLNDLIKFVHIGPTDTSAFFAAVSPGSPAHALPLTIATHDEQRLERMLIQARREGAELFGGYFRDSVNAAYYDRSYFDHGMQWYGDSFARFGAQYGKALCVAYFGTAPCPVTFQEHADP